MRYMIWLCLLFATAHAKEAFPLLTSADGSQTLRAKPIALTGDDIVFLKDSGKTFTASLEKFSNKDKESLREWSAAMKNSYHARLIERVHRADTLRVLFVGNSYSFQIPKRFASLAKANGKKVYVKQVTKGGWTLKRHANAENTLREITTGNWDVVVLQEQSQVPSFPEPQRSTQMDAAAKKLVETVSSAKAIPVFFQTWGRRDGDKQNAAMFPNDTMQAMQTRLNQGYANAAQNAGGAHIIPVGTVWTTAKLATPEMGLYTKDGSHPAKIGNLLGAGTFFTALYNEVPKLNEKGASEFLAHLQGAKLKPIPFPLSR